MRNIHNITNCDMLYTSYKTTTKRKDGYCIVRYNQNLPTKFSSYISDNGHDMLTHKER